MSNFKKFSENLDHVKLCQNMFPSSYDIRSLKRGS